MNVPPVYDTFEQSSRNTTVDFALIQSADASSEDEFSDAREALASPTRALASRLDRLESNSAPLEATATERQVEQAQELNIYHTDIKEREDNSQAQDEDEEDLSRNDSSDGIPNTASTVSHQVEVKSDGIQESVRMQRKPAFTVPPTSSNSRKSLIAADGGFGPMDVEICAEHENYQAVEKEEEEGEEEEEGRVTSGNTDPVSIKPADPEVNIAGDDDFDDFEAGEEGDGFDEFEGGFDDGQPPAPSPEPNQSLVDLPYPLLDFSMEVPTASNLEMLILPHLNAVFPASGLARRIHGADIRPEDNAGFLSDRSYSLWQQLLSPPPLQPQNWVRSRIRRLFLVSLGVPVDLDEILPKTKQKKLILAYDSTAVPPHAGSKLKDNEGVSASENHPRRTRGPLPPPDFSMEEVLRLCRMTSADLDGMTNKELELHVQRLESLADIGKTVLQYWVKRKELAVDEKEAFDSVVESLVRHARRVRH